MLSNVLLGINIAVFAYFAIINGFYFFYWPCLTSHYSSTEDRPSMSSGDG